ncbi:mechanosensitive ion channel domain-containing protein [Photobacterium lipolyticum]|nr:mechanosensitive ion channel domain-containing protein [Photobacterium lipolyticum]
MRTTWCHRLLCVVFIFCGNLSAQDEQNDLLNISNKPNNEAGVLVVPEASALETDWWHFFDDEPASLDQRVQVLEKRLNALLASLPPEALDSGRELRDQIIANLQALAKIRGQKPFEPPVIPAFKQAYSIQAWLELESRYRDKKKEVVDERADIDHLSTAVEAATNQYDTEMASYISVTATEPNKMIQGMEIMAMRSALELARQRLSRNRDVLISLQRELETLYNEKKFAEQRLVATGDEIPVLKKELSNQEQTLIKASNFLNSTRSKALGAIAETPEAAAKNRLQEQRVIYASVEEAIARLHVTATQGIIALTALLSNGEINSDELHDQFEVWKTLVKETSGQLAGWQAKSLREQGRSQTQLLNQPLATAELKALHENRNQLSRESLLKLQELNDLRLNLVVLTEMCRLQLAKQEGVLKHWWITVNEMVESGWMSASGFLTGSLFKIGDTPVTILGLLRVVLIVTIALFFSSLLRRMLAKIAERNEDESSALYTIGRLGHYVILLVGMMIALSSIGLDFSNLALVAGALSVGIGFGLQSIVNNFVSGLILLFERSLKVGDFVELDSGVLGIVMEINVRSTLINTNDNVDIIVPNSELVGAKVTNWTLRDATRRMRIPFGVAYGSDKNQVKKAVLEAADRVPETLRRSKKHEPQVWLVGFGDSSLDFELVVWVSQAAVKRPAGVTAAYMWEIETSLQQYGIEIPFPQRDLHVRSLFEKKGAEAEAILRGKL